MSLWNELSEIHDGLKSTTILNLFDQNPNRFDQFSLVFGDMLFDFSKTKITAKALKKLVELAHETGVESKRDAMFRGEKINETEDRAVLHTALRNLSGRDIQVDGKDVMPGVLSTLNALKTFSADVRSGAYANANGERFTDVVNIGIGGSDLGPVMATLALAPYHDGPRTHFISNIDPADLNDTLEGLNPSTTLLIVASKTFTTIETMTNAATAKAWLEKVVDPQVSGRHIVALSSNVEKAGEFGIAPERVFGFEDWVGGRYSIWGPIGLSLMLAIGPDGFEEFLKGAEEIDQHFLSAPLNQNIPVILALLGVWHNNICGYDTRAVLPYDQRLSRLPAYLQQLDMESNGKSVQMNGASAQKETGPIVWGEPGTNGQHAFYQLIHQGTRVVPTEFLVARHSHEPHLSHQHNLLLANCLAQSEALMIGRSLEVAMGLMKAKGYEGEECKKQASHRVFSGDRPSTTLMYSRLNPNILGKIIALYEHRVFVEGVVWGINSFDQWGVELGKELAVQLLPLIEENADASAKDGSTQGLLKALKA